MIKYELTVDFRMSSKHLNNTDDDYARKFTFIGWLQSVVSFVDIGRKYVIAYVHIVHVTAKQR